MKINQDLLERLETWRTQTKQRSVDIKAERGNVAGDWSIWIYDYFVSYGIYVDEQTADKDWSLEILKKNAQNRKAAADQAAKRLEEYNDGIPVG